MTRVKVCGVTSATDAAEIAQCGVHAVGVILVAGTPRYMGDRWSDIRAIRDAVGPFVGMVAVVRDLQEAQRFPERIFTAVQYYEGGDPGQALAGLRRIRAVHFREDAWADVTMSADDALLLDTYDPDRLGGSGRQFDWHACCRLNLRGQRVIVAGGLTPANVSDAIRALRPYAVDVSSGVESAPGRKDIELVRRFMDRVRETDAAIAREERVEP